MGRSGQVRHGSWLGGGEPEPQRGKGPMGIGERAGGKPLQEHNRCQSRVIRSVLRPMVNRIVFTPLVLTY